MDGCEFPKTRCGGVIEDLFLESRGCRRTLDTEGRKGELGQKAFWKVRRVKILLDVRVLNTCFSLVKTDRWIFLWIEATI